MYEQISHCVETGNAWYFGYQAKTVEEGNVIVQLDDSRQLPIRVVVSMDKQEPQADMPRAKIRVLSQWDLRAFLNEMLVAATAWYWHKAEQHDEAVNALLQAPTGNSVVPMWVYESAQDFGKSASVATLVGAIKVFKPLVEKTR